MKIFKTLSLAAAALALVACGNNAQKAKEAAEREKAIADSIAQAEIAAKEASFEEFFATLPEEPVFDMTRFSFTPRLPCTAKTSQNLPIPVFTTDCCSTG